MSRSARVVFALVAVQVILGGIYWLVEQQRSPDGVSEPVLSRAPPQRLEGRVQPLSVRTRNGGRLDLQALERPTLVHFWATWCPPCRAELPGLLAVSEDHPVDVVAVALDEEWVDIDRFLNGRRPSGVFLGDAAEVESAFGVHTLPVTFLVDAGGRLRLRFDGARDWTDRDFVSKWIDEAGHGTSVK